MKVGSNYATILRGVSQQSPQERAEGQHTEQVNMLSDPVRGLARRHGSHWQAERNLGVGTAAAAHVADTAETRSTQFTSLGVDYTLVRRATPRTGAGPHLSALTCYDRTNKAFLPTVTAVGDTAAQALEVNGVAAVTSVGKYLFLTANNTPVTGSTTNVWDSPANHSYAVCWVRGGAYSRTFTVTLRTQAGATRTVTYTTPASSYGATLDTSDILVTDPEYTKKVNDRVNAYNSAVTAWIGTSTAAVQPAAIATQLAAALNADTSPWVTVVGAHILVLPSRNVRSIETSDGGDGSLIRAVADEVTSADRVSILHYPGKVVKVRASGAQDAYYLVAQAKAAGVTGYQEVTWVEGAGAVSTIAGGLFYALPHAGSLYLASSEAHLSTLVAGVHPAIMPSVVGDADSSPMPAFVGKQVTYLGTFQNRLLVGSGGTLALSRTEDYLNFFRSTVLTVPASDAFEMTPTGSEADVLVASTLYDQDLVVFGTRRQYILSGTVALTPTSAAMPVLTSFDGIVDAAPCAAGGIVFYAKRLGATSSVFQIQPGQSNKSPEAYPVASQLDDYIAGGITDLAVVTGSPSLLVARSTAVRDTLFTFSYLDRPDGRKLDAWSKWTFSADCGSILGLASVTDGLLVLFLRKGSDGEWRTVADLVPVATKLSDYPYLDSLRPYAALATPGHSLSTTAAYDWRCATVGGDRHLVGGALTTAGTLTAPVWVGSLYQSSVTPTSPYVRAVTGKAVTEGRTVVTRMSAALADSSGVAWSVADVNGQATGEFNGRVLGTPSNAIGRVPVSTGPASIAIGKETSAFTLTLSARKWYPLTVTSLSWVGQIFNRIPRVQ